VPKAKLIQSQQGSFGQGRFSYEIKAYEVPLSRRFPRGIKLKCALIDRELGKPLVLLDNHEPFGFHLHSLLPDNPDFRMPLDIRNSEEAIRIFFDEVRKVIRL
jgi:hypothetical protein